MRPVLLLFSAWLSFSLAANLRLFQSYCNKFDVNMILETLKTFDLGKGNVQQALKTCLSTLQTNKEAFVSVTSSTEYLLHRFNQHTISILKEFDAIVDTRTLAHIELIKRVHANSKVSEYLQQHPDVSFNSLVRINIIREALLNRLNKRLLENLANTPLSKQLRAEIRSIPEKALDKALAEGKLIAAVMMIAKGTSPPPKFDLGDVLSKVKVMPDTSFRAVCLAGTPALLKGLFSKGPVSDENIFLCLSNAVKYGRADIIAETLQFREGLFLEFLQHHCSDIPALMMLWRALNIYGASEETFKIYSDHMIKLMRETDWSSEANDEEFTFFKAISSKDKLDRQYDLRSLDELGKGAVGVVFKAQCRKNSDNFSALKLIDLSKVSDKLPILKEILISTVLEHRHVNKFKDVYFVAPNKIWISSELATHSLLTIAEGLKAHNARSVSEELRATEIFFANICKEILLGLQFMHSRRVVHCDIKSENIMIDGAGLIKIIDLGSSMILPDAIGGKIVQEVKGTLNWLAPETSTIYLLGGIGFDEKIDIWSLGGVLYELLEGEMPFQTVFNRLMRPVSCLQFAAQNGMNLNNPLRWSVELKEFFSLCTTVDSNARPSATDLLKHPFIALADAVDAQSIAKELIKLSSPVEEPTTTLSALPKAEILRRASTFYIANEESSEDPTASISNLLSASYAAALGESQVNTQGQLIRFSKAVRKTGNSPSPTSSMIDQPDKPVSLLDSLSLSAILTGDNFGSGSDSLSRSFIWGNSSINLEASLNAANYNANSSALEDSFFEPRNYRASSDPLDSLDLDDMLREEVQRGEQTKKPPPTGFGIDDQFGRKGLDAFSVDPRAATKKPPQIASDANTKNAWGERSLTLDELANMGDGQPIGGNVLNPRPIHEVDGFQDSINPGDADSSDDLDNFDFK